MYNDIMYNDIMVYGYNAVMITSYFKLASKLHFFICFIFISDDYH